MIVLIFCGLFTVLATAHNITRLEVPQFSDPRSPTELVCHYSNDLGDPDLHSVKWYQDNHEIFRYTPGSQPSTRTFNSTLGGVTKGFCNGHRCSVSVVLPKKYDTRVAFTCEVSTEGPRFAVVKQTKYTTVAVILKDDPVIAGAPGDVQLGDDVIMNCSTAAAMPPADIRWYVDGELHQSTEPWMMDRTGVSNADSAGLRSSWRVLQFRVSSTSGIVHVRCETYQPTTPPQVRSANVSLPIVRSPHLSMFTAFGSSSHVEMQLALVVSCISIHWFSTCSAFSEMCNMQH